MAKVVISIVNENPSKDVMYRLDRINENAVQYKWVTDSARFEIVKTDTLNGFPFKCTTIEIHCKEEDKIFWIGVYNGKDLGINIAKQMYSIS